MTATGLAGGPPVTRAATDVVVGARREYGDWQRDRTFGLTIELGAGIDLVLALRGEARTLMDKAELITDSGLVENPDGSLTTDRRLSFSPAGPVLQAIQRSAALLATMRACAGLAELRPGPAGYNFYRTGDHLGVHRDTQQLAITVVLDLIGNLPAMGWAPGYAGATSREVLELARTRGIFPAGQSNLPVPRDHLRAFAGNEVPHWRCAFEGELGMLAICSFTVDGPGKRGRS
jgi:hypothetical protein